jgi:hypothetical protein
MKEKFKTLKKFPRYVISNKGYVVNKKTGKIISPYLFNNYFYVRLTMPNGKSTGVGLHRLVIENFKNATKRDYAIHLDFNTGNNEETNLDKVKGRSGLYQWRKNIEKVNRCVYDNHFFKKGRSKKPFKGILNIKGKSIHVGYFKTKQETEKACAVIFKRKMGFEMSRVFSSGAN